MGKTAKVPISGAATMSAKGRKWPGRTWPQADLTNVCFPAQTELPQVAPHGALLGRPLVTWHRRLKARSPHLSC